MLCSTLLLPSLFLPDKHFSLMNPKYNVDNNQIASFLTEKLAGVQIKKKKGLKI